MVKPVEPQPVLTPLTEAAIFLVAVVRDGGEDTVRDLIPDVAGIGSLRGWLARHGETCATAEPEYAFYNSPMIPPPLRRNEVLLALG